MGTLQNDVGNDVEANAAYFANNSRLIGMPLIRMRSRASIRCGEV